jgi:hypothetical protein
MTTKPKAVNLAVMYVKVQLNSKQSIRWCSTCLTHTLWEYNHIIGHSACSQCGGHFGTDFSVKMKKEGTG